MAKKYFWLKLKDDFFQDKRIKKLRRVAGGDTYTVIYLKMQLLSLKNEGVLFYEGIEDSFAQEIALEIDEDEDNVKFTIMFLQANGLLEEVDENSFALIETMHSIGSETQGAERVRRFRENQKALQCNARVTKRNTEIEKEIDIEKELEKEQQQEKKDDVAVVPSTINPFTFYQENGFGLTMNSITHQKINAWCEDLSDELVVHAMQKAIESNAIRWAYVESILKNWHQKKVKSVADVQALDAQFAAQQQNKQQRFSKPSKTEVTPTGFESWQRAGSNKQESPPSEFISFDEKRKLLESIRKNTVNS